MSKKKKSPARKTEKHNIAMNTGRKVKIYIDDEIIATSKTVEIYKIKLDKN
jgi:hypothetical protein